MVIRRQGQGDGPPLHLECARVDLEEGPEVLRRAVGELLPARLEIPGEPRQEVSQRGGSGGELGADALGQEGVVLGRCCCPSSCCCCCCCFIAPFREDLGDGSPELLEVNGLALLVDDKVIRVVEEEVSELLHVLAGDVADLGRGLGAVTEQTLEIRGGNGTKLTKRTIFSLLTFIGTSMDSPYWRSLFWGKEQNVVILHAAEK